MDRETKELKIGGVVYVVKTYATAREANAIQQAYFKGTKLEVVGDQPKISEFNPGVQFEVYQELIRQIVVQVGDIITADAIVETCVNLPSADFDELVSALDQLVTKKKS